MADVHSREVRSYNMSQIRGKDTKPEEITRKYLFSKGFRYRKNVSTLPGKPDIVLPKYRTVVFIHGCFWHKHEGCKYFVWPKNNAEFWKEKITKNVERDLQQQRELRSLGWNVIVVWECELKKSKFEETMASIATFFDVDVGYLTGEIDAESYTEEKVSSYLGLSSSAIQVIKRATSSDRFSPNTLFTPTETICQILNRFLTAKNFPLFLETMAELASVYEDQDKVKRLWEDAESKYGKELLSEAINHHDDAPEQGDPEPRPELLEAINTVNDIIDRGYEIETRSEFYSDLFRYRLQRVYNNLIDEIFPPFQHD